jgi:glutamate racemase
MTAAPIGVFDSGVGGLSVLRAIRAELPGEDLLYVADSAHVPYGDKPAAFIQQRSIAVAEFLLQHKAKAIVVACNTATGAAIADMRARFRVPIVGMEPALKPALDHTRTGKIGVLATSGTINSDKFAHLLARFGSRAEVLVQPCPGWVEAVECGELDSAASLALVERYLAPLLQRGVDTLVLGCTHYPFLRALIEEVAGAAVGVIDPSPAIARELRRRLHEGGLLCERAGDGHARFWSSGVLERVAPLLSRLWREPVSVQPIDPG